MRNTILLLLTLFALGSNAQEKNVSTEIEHVDSEYLVPLNFVSDQLKTIEKQTSSVLERALENWTHDCHIKVRQTISPEKEIHYSIATKPVLSDSLLEGITQVLSDSIHAHSLYLPFTLTYTLTLNKGCTNRKANYTPKWERIENERQDKIKQLNLLAKYEELRAWCSKAAWPITTQLLLQEASGNIPLINDLNQLSASVQKSELARLNQLVNQYPALAQSLLTLKAIKLAFEGKPNYAQTYLELIYQFDQNNSARRIIMDQLNWRLNLFFAGESQEIQLAEKTLNSGDHESYYNQLTAITNKIPGTLISLKHLTENAKINGDQYRSAFYTASPIGKVILKPIVAEEAYKNTLREATDLLFIDPETMLNSFHTYGEIALKLGAYEFATDFYSLYLNHPMTGTTTLPEYSEKDQVNLQFAKFKLGELENPSKKTAKEFKRLVKKHRKQKKKNPVYKNFNP